MYVLVFVKDCDEHAQFTVAFPTQWNLGTITYQAFWSGTDNTGGGGGGTAGSSQPTTYGRGGSGVVILRVAASDYSGTTSGSPTVSDSGSDKVLEVSSIVIGALLFVSPPFINTKLGQKPLMQL